MIGIQQWRAVIGCFVRRSAKQKTKITTLNVPLGSLLNIKMTLLFSLCILLCGDIESNPGPENYQSIMDELKTMRKENENNFKDLRQDISSLKSDLSALSKKVDENTRDIDHIYDDYYGQIQSLRNAVSNMEKKIEEQERYSRRDNIIMYNIIMYNIPHDTGENNTTTKAKLIKVLNENTDKVWANMTS